MLGPLLVRRCGILVSVPAGKQRAVLAALLLDAGRVVSLDELTDVLWGSSPPPSARVATQNYVMRLRKALGDVGRSRISTQPPGYLIRATPGEVDLSRFQEHLRAARAAAPNSAAEAAAEARAGLALWRGEPLADVDSELLAVRDVPRLGELRLQALEVRLDADLRLGRHAEVITDLRQLTGTYPLRERLHGLLMLALYRDGRQAEALAAYQNARQVLVEEVGAEPGAGLCGLHRQILASDPALMIPVSTAVRRAVPVPQELPAPVSPFVGRANELAALTAGLLDRSDMRVISVIGGSPGVGKTALAVHWAHQVAERFPDGQLYVNLRGYDPGQPLPAADALARFLRSLGVSGKDIPAAQDERAGRYRSLLAGRRMLVVLDNASEAEQVRPLLPGAPTCVVVVTSRDGLVGLVARDGARRVDLGMLAPADAVSLLRALIGPRVDADRDAAATLVELCCRLPLALRVAAELTVSRPQARLAELAGELADQRHRLDLLDAAGDPRTAMRAVFSWSFRHLDPETARAFRLLGLHPGPNIDPHAAAALTGATPKQTGRLLNSLARAYLIQPCGQDRYGMHDLLRVYAREHAAQDSAHEQRAALTRLFDHYLHTAAVAMDLAFPAEADRRPRLALPAGFRPPVAGVAEAWTWLDTERPTLTAVVAHAAAHGWPAHATGLAATLFRYLETGGYTLETIAIHDHAHKVARDLGDRAAEAEALHGLIVIDLRQGRYQQAIDHLEQLLVTYRDTGNETGEADTLGNLGIAAFLQGRYQHAIIRLRQALAIYRATGNQAGTARQLSNLGLVELRLGDYHQASDHLDQAVTLCCETGNRSTESYALSNLGLTSLRLGNHQQAREHLEQALSMCHESGNRDCEAYALGNLGLVQSRLGDHQQARKHIEHALRICRETNDRSSEAETLNNLGEILYTAGLPEDAHTHHAAALGLASQIHNNYEQARAHNGLAHSYDATGNPHLAHQHWQQALTIYTNLGAPESSQIRARL